MILGKKSRITEFVISNCCVIKLERIFLKLWFWGDSGWIVASKLIYTKISRSKILELIFDEN